MSYLRHLKYLNNSKILPSIIIIAWLVIVIDYSLCVRDVYLGWDRIDSPVLACFSHLTILALIHFIIPFSLIITRMQKVSTRSDIIYLVPTSIFVIINSIIYLSAITVHAIFIWHLPTLANITILSLAWYRLYNAELVE